MINRENSNILEDNILKGKEANVTVFLKCCMPLMHLFFSSTFLYSENLLSNASFACVCVCVMAPAEEQLGGHILTVFSNTQITLTHNPQSKATDYDVSENTNQSEFEFPLF